MKRQIVRQALLWLGVLLMLSGVFVATALRASESVSIVIIAVIGMLGYGLVRFSKTFRD